MNYVYILQSGSHPDRFYTGLCKDVEAGLAAHNAGQSPHTAKFKPWRLLSCHISNGRKRPQHSSAISRAARAGPSRSGT
ncbi:MAG: putative endonuclease [Sphingomonadales bacterium]|jgi:predicted GIY-YIG superfamily endonuclease|nr:putative endonuclease [Sphingomonadales bacterium]